jgi:hypothetical protein
MNDFMVDFVVFGLRPTISAAAAPAAAAAAAAAGFQRVYNYSQVDAKCRLCQLLVEHRKAPEKYTMCYANSTWQGASKSTVKELLSSVTV